MASLEKIIDALTQNGFKAQAFDTADQAKAAALELIGNGSVGFGGSITVDNMSIYDELKQKGNAVYWHWKIPPEERAAIFPKANTADTYICSTNAILKSGKLLNIDGNGNRVSSMYCGPKQVIVIAGKNKICGDYDDAMQRIKRDACPLNAKRLGLKTPCAATGVCTDCHSSQRMCNITVLMERPGMVKNIHVFIVNEALGY